MNKKIVALLMAIWLAACGGGGGGGDAATTSAPSTSNFSQGAVTFSPGKVILSYDEGSSKTFSVTAKINNPGDFADASQVVAYIVDDTGVISKNVNIVEQDDLTYIATFQTSPSIAAGYYQGNFMLKLCRDSACAAQFPGSPSLLPFDIQVLQANANRLNATSTLPLAASIHAGADTFSESIVSVKANNLSWTAKSTASWLKLANASGTGSGSFTVRFDAAGLSQGEYSDTVTVTSNDGQSVSLPATLTVLPTAFQVTPAGLAFSAINGAPIQSQPLSFDISSKTTTAWTASTNAAWLSVTPASGTTPGAATVQVDPSVGPLASGSYSAEATLSAKDIPGKTLAIKLDLLKASLTASTKDLVFGGSKGRDFSTQSLTLGLNTQSNSWPWSLSGLPAWATASETAGSVNQGGTSVNFVPLVDKADVGTTIKPFNVTTKVNGDTLVLPITASFHKDQHRILASETGIAFAATPVGTRLSRSISVTDNFGKSTSWTASSDQPWLSVTQSGITGSGDSVIKLVADPASLPNNAVSYATITITAAATTISAPEKIRVALWKDATSKTTMSKLGAAYTKIASDPIRPFTYVHSGGTAIDVYNVYTAQKIQTIPNMGAALGDMAVSPDGAKLYVLDTAARQISVADLSSLTKATTWPVVNAVSAYTSLRVIRPNGVQVVLVGDGTAYAAADGRKLGGTGISGSITASSDGKRVYTQDSGLSPATVRSYEVDYSEISGGILMVKKLHEASFINGASNGRDIAVSGDGLRLYTASGAPYYCVSIDTAHLTSIGLLPDENSYPNNIEVGSDGRVYCGASASYDSPDVQMHDANGAKKSALVLDGSLLNGQLVVSSDGLIVIALTDAPALSFVPVMP